MITSFITFSIICAIIEFIGILYSNTIDNNFYVGFTLCLFILGFIIGFIMCTICFKYEDEPTALDVYQDKTTLEITYKDGVPIDSVVVFKNK